MITSNLPAYLYQQYGNDANILAFFNSLNTSSQAYLDQLNNLNLPIYTSPSITGALLDWVALGLYGFNRPILTQGGAVLAGGNYNSNDYNTTLYNAGKVTGGSSIVDVTDDIFKRCITWNFYKGDGMQFTAQWLKNRVQRFLVGVNGAAPVIDNTYNVSVTYGASNSVVIHIVGGYQAASAAILQSAVAFGVLQLPFQYNFSVTY